MQIIPDNQGFNDFEKIINFLITSFLADNNRDIIKNTGIKNNRFYDLKNGDSKLSKSDIEKLEKAYGEDFKKWFQTELKGNTNTSQTKVIRNTLLDNDKELTNLLKTNAYLIRYIELEKQVNELEKEVSKKIADFSDNEKKQILIELDELKEINQKIKDIKNNFSL